MRLTTTVALLSVFLLASILGSGGCKTGEATSPSTEQPRQQATQADQKALQDLLKYAQETGQTLEELQQTVARWQAAQQEGAKTAPVATDLEVIDGLLAEARKAGEAKQTEGMRALLRRMNRVARGLLAELPGQVIAQRAERALWALSKEQPDTDQAAAAILYAVDAAVKAKEPKLVPDVVGDLEAAKAAMSKDLEAAKKHLLSVEDKCGRDAAALKAYNLVVALEGAFEALQREAWPVVMAELEEAEILVKDLKHAAGLQSPAAEGQTQEEQQQQGAQASQGTSQTAAPETGQPSNAPAQGEPTGTASDSKQGQPNTAAAGAEAAKSPPQSNARPPAASPPLPTAPPSAPSGNAPASQESGNKRGA